MLSTNMFIYFMQIYFDILYFIALLGTIHTENIFDLKKARHWSIVK